MCLHVFVISSISHGFFHCKSLRHNYSILYNFMEQSCRQKRFVLIQLVINYVIYLMADRGTISMWWLLSNWQSKSSPKDSQCCILALRCKALRWWALSEHPFIHSSHISRHLSAELLSLFSNVALPSMMEMLWFVWQKQFSVSNDSDESWQ